jgi:DNA polymerase II small subunit
MSTNSTSTTEIIHALFDHDILVSPEQAKLLTDRDALVLKDLLKFPKEAEVYLEKIEQRSRATTISQSSSFPQESFPQEARAVTILKHYEKRPQKRTYQHFVNHFTTRYNGISKLLRGRKDLQSVMPVEKIRRSAPNDTVVAIGLVADKRETKNDHVILALEDRTGSINVLCSKNKLDVHALAHDTGYDDVIAVTGKLGQDIIFADSISIPDVPLQRELKRSPDEAYLVCFSDIHVGNKHFMAEEFATVIKWLRGELGTDAWRAIAKKTLYVMIPGDIIEGVGIYPSQEGDLAIPDIYAQYVECENILDRIPKEKHLFIIPGNHDIGRLSEPQPRLPKEVMPRMYARENTYLLSNPSTVKIHQQQGFPGFDVLLYHGGSFIYYGNAVPSLFKEGGVNNPCAIMQHLLKRRHLAPAHTSTLYVPDPENDPLAIEDVPDFIITGHLHMTQSKTWRGVTMLSCSCWVPITDYQQKQGLKCDPGKFILVNLKTRAVKLVAPSDLFEDPS